MYKSKIKKIMNLALQVSPPDVNPKYRIGKPEVFINWLSSTNTLTVEVYKKGFKFSKTADASFHVFCNCEDAEEDLQNIVNYLNEILCKEGGKDAGI